MVSVTPLAAEKVKEIIAKDGSGQGAYLRVSVQGGGCSGFTYNLQIDHKQDDDTEFESNGITIVVDSMSLRHLENAEIDYKTVGLMGGFVVGNPNATSTCGCGHSFSTDDTKPADQ